MQMTSEDKAIHYRMRHNLNLWRFDLLRYIINLNV
jgi:hypothetical protein